MKQLKYIFLALGVVLSLASCSKNDAIDMRVDPSDYFVMFDTKSGTAPSLSVVENKSVVVTVNIGATKGPSTTVSFDVTAPSTPDPASAMYKLYTMDGTTEMTTKTLTFPEGTGSQSFIFSPVDNELLDKSRDFTLKLTNNSAGYRTGVNSTGEGATMKITVIDDEHPLKEWTGEWTMTSEAGSAKSRTLNLVGGDKDDQVKISAFPVYNGVALDIPITFDLENKTVKISPIKGIPSGYGTYMLARIDNPDTEEEAVVEGPLNGVINDDGSIAFPNSLLFFQITDGNNAGAAFSWYQNFVFTR